LKGSKCRCGFATVSNKRRCSRCGKQMRPSEWPDQGKVLSFSRLQVIPEGFDTPYNLALVEIPKGPKLACWTSGTLKVDDDVTVTEQHGKYLCNLRTNLAFKLDKDAVKI